MTFVSSRPSIGQQQKAFTQSSPKVLLSSFHFDQFVKARKSELSGKVGLCVRYSKPFTILVQGVLIYARRPKMIFMCILAITDEHNKLSILRCKRSQESLPLNRYGLWQTLTFPDQLFLAQGPSHKSFESSDIFEKSNYT